MPNRAAQQSLHAAIQQLGRLSELFQRRRAQLAENVGLTEHQWGVLEEISTEHFMPSMFARQRESTPAAVSKTIRQLVERGLVSVSLHSGDARQRRYELTATGHTLIERLRESRQEAIAKVWASIPEAQLSEFVRFGQDLGDRLEKLVREFGASQQPRAATRGAQQQDAG